MDRIRNVSNDRGSSNKVTSTENFLWMINLILGLEKPFYGGINFYTKLSLIVDILV